MVESFTKANNLIIGYNSTGKTSRLKEVYSKLIDASKEVIYISSNRIEYEDKVDKIKVEEVLKLFNKDDQIKKYIDEVNGKLSEDNKIEVNYSAEITEEGLKNIKESKV